MDESVDKGCIEEALKCDKGSDLYRSLEAAKKRRSRHTNDEMFKIEKDLLACVAQALPEVENRNPYLSHKEIVDRGLSKIWLMIAKRTGCGRNIVEAHNRYCRIFKKAKDALLFRRSYYLLEDVLKIGRQFLIDEAGNLKIFNNRRKRTAQEAELDETSLIEDHPCEVAQEIPTNQNDQNKADEHELMLEFETSNVPLGGLIYRFKIQISAKIIK